MMHECKLCVHEEVCNLYVELGVTQRPCGNSLHCPLYESKFNRDIDTLRKTNLQLLGKIAKLTKANIKLEASMEKGGEGK